MFCSTTYHCKFRKHPKFKRRQQFLKLFNYCRKKLLRIFGRSLDVLKGEKCLKKASKSKKFSKGERHE